MVSAQTIPKMLVSAVISAIVALGLPTGASARTLSGPDLAVASVDAPPQILSGRPFTIAVRIVERDGIAAGATVTVSANGAVVATQPVAVDAGGTAALSFQSEEHTSELQSL